MIADSIRKQSAQIFLNIQYIFDALNDENIDSRVGVFPLWKQVYHMLHSIDRNFIDPGNYAEPAFHEKNLNVIFMDSARSLTITQLRDYFGQIRSKISGYLDSLTDAFLEETIVFRDMKLSRMELILAQFRHIFYHIGYLHCCFKLLNGETPEYAGLYKVIPEK